MRKLLMFVMTLLASVHNVSAYPLTIEHGQGSTVIPQTPQRVVVFDLAALDTLDALGVTVSAVPQAPFPQYLSRYADEKIIKVGDLFKPDMAALKALQPDLIIIAARSRAAYPELSQLAPTIDLTIDPNQFVTGVEHNLNVLGEIFNKQPQAEKLQQALQEQLKGVQTSGAQQGSGLVLFTIKQNMMLHAPGDRFGMLYALTGLQSVAAPSAAAPGPRAKPGSEEAKKRQQEAQQRLTQALEHNPEWLIVLDRGAATGDEGEAEQTLAADKRVTGTKAWQSKQVYFLNPGEWYLATGGYQSVMNTLNDLKTRFSR